MDRRTLMTIVAVTASRVGLLSIWFAALVLIYRTLGKTPDGLAEAGLFAFAMATIRLFVSWIGDTVDLEVMRRVPLLLAEDRSAGFAAWRAATAVRLGAAIVAAVFLIVMAGPISTFFMQGQHSWILIYCGIGTVAEIMIRAELSFLQADETYRRFLRLEGLWQASRFISIAVLAAFGHMSGHTAVAAYVGSSAFAALLGAAALPRGVLVPFTVTRADLTLVINYVKWIVPAIGFVAVSERLDVFLVKYFGGTAAAGLFGGVLSLALIPDALSGFLATTLQPRVTRLYRDGSFNPFLNWFTKIALPVCIAATVLTVLLGPSIVVFVLGPTYASVTSSFVVMTIATLVWLALTPLPLALVALVQPTLMFKITLASGIAGTLMRIILIPWLGIFGAALALLILRVVLGIYLVLVARRMSRHLEKPLNVEQEVRVSAH